MKVLEDRDLYGIVSEACDKCIKRAYEPVSYTHLDVYKRQPLVRLAAPVKQENSVFRSQSAQYRT